MLSSFSKLIPETERERLRKQVLFFGAGYENFALLENQGEAFAPSWMAKGWIVGIKAAQPSLRASAMAGEESGGRRAESREQGAESGEQRARSGVRSGAGDVFEQLKSVEFQLPLFGYLGYDLKNQVEKLESNNRDRIGAEEAMFFEPDHYLRFDGETLTIQSFGDAEAVWKAISQQAFEEKSIPSLTLTPQLSKPDYLRKVEEVIENIRAGEVYELNLCVEHSAENVQLDPVSVYLKLMEMSEVPFAAFLKTASIYTLCASPERFLQKKGDKLLTQPIKGTRKRGASAAEDTLLKKELLDSEKDRAENVMIVDLVRNDLTRSCRYGSIQVEELFGIYSFTNVHQMISTVSGILRPEVHWADAIRYAFPMGSMTGAPKVRAMQVIEEIEESKRGIYSGSIGVIFPNGDFELNVVIRTLLYHEKDAYLSVHAGGAITYDSKAEEEYEEIQTKLSNIRKLFGA